MEESTLSCVPSPVSENRTNPRLSLKIRVSSSNESDGEEEERHSTLLQPEVYMKDTSLTESDNVLICQNCRKPFTVALTILESRVIDYCIPCYRTSMIRMSQEKLVFRPNHIDSHIYLGSARCASSLSILQELNITHVLVVGNGLTCHFPQEISYFHIEIEDEENQDIGKHFMKAIYFLEYGEYFQCEKTEKNSLTIPKIAFLDEEFSMCNFPSPSSFSSSVVARSSKKERGNVLVHCYAGVSRSASIVIAYFMHKHKLSLLDAMKLVKSKRSCISPNVGFLLQLKEFEKELQTC
jgi:protein-tyrosine phosphatase